MTAINQTPAGKTRILVLGGGFAGIHTVLSLEKRFAQNSAVDILLINRENFFLFTPMLSEVAIGTLDPRHIVLPIRELCQKTEFHRAEVTQIDLKHQTVDVFYNSVERCPDTIAYDHLVIALGSTSNVMLVPGVDKYAFNFKELGDALLIRNHVLEMFERADTAVNPAEKRALLTFCVVGGGYSGVELAAGLQEFALRIAPLYPTIEPEDIQVVLVEAQNRILSTMPPELAAYAQAQLAEMGVDIQLKTRLTEVTPTKIYLENDIKIPTYTTVWATGITPSPVVSGLAISKTEKGQPLGTSELRLAGYDNVWAVGDNVLTPIPGKTGFFPATAQLAVQQGVHVTGNIARALKGEPLKPFSYEPKGEMVVLGERSAVALVFGIKLRGFMAWVLWRLFYLSKLPRWKKKTRVALDWFLSLFGPLETTQIKIYNRQEPCTSEDLVCDRQNIPEHVRLQF